MWSFYLSVVARTIASADPTLRHSLLVREERRNTEEREKERKKDKERRKDRQTDKKKGWR